MLKLARIFVGLNLLDLLLTLVALQSNLVLEGSPLVYLLGAKSALELSLWKISMIFLVGLVLVFTRKYRILKLLNIGLAIICLWNLVMIILANLVKLN